MRPDPIAIQRCLDAGYLDPYFVGDKGYPNWMMFTDKAITQTKRFVEETRKIFDDDQ